MADRSDRLSRLTVFKRVADRQYVPPPIDWLNDHGDLLFTVGGDQPALYRLDQAGQ